MTEPYKYLSATLGPLSQRCHELDWISKEHKIIPTPLNVQLMTRRLSGSSAISLKALVVVTSSASPSGCSIKAASWRAYNPSGKISHAYRTSLSGVVMLKGCIWFSGCHQLPDRTWKRKNDKLENPNCSGLFGLCSHAVLILFA